MWRTFTGRSGRVERRGVRAQMGDMERRLGGASAAARAAGVNRGTWWRIKTGRTRAPRPETAQRVRSAHRQHFSTEGRRALVGAATTPRRRITGYGPRFHGSYRVNGYDRSAPFRLYSGEALGHLAAAQDAFLAADDAGARAELNAALSAEIGYPTEAVDGEVEWT
jgi:hypothetical protein